MTPCILMKVSRKGSTQVIIYGLKALRIKSVQVFPIWICCDVFKELLIPAWVFEIWKELARNGRKYLGGRKSIKSDLKMSLFMMVFTFSSSGLILFNLSLFKKNCNIIEMHVLVSLSL